MKQHRLSTDLFRFLDSVSEERRLVLAVVKQDVERHLAAHHVVDRLLHHVVEVSGGVHLVKHVVDLRHFSQCVSVTVVHNSITFLWVTLYFVPSISRGSSLTSDLRARPYSSSLVSESDKQTHNKCSTLCLIMETAGKVLHKTQVRRSSSLCSSVFKKKKKRKVKKCSKNILVSTEEYRKFCLILEEINKKIQYFTGIEFFTF